MTLSVFDPLQPTLQKIRDRTAAYDDLRCAHHFLFSLPRNVSDEGAIKIVIIGVNPGESAFDRKHSPGYGYEESFEYDFHENAKKRAPASSRWLGRVDYFTDFAPSVLTEIFFWSSKNIQELADRYGELSHSKHLDFCVECNATLLRVLKPSVVIGVGLGMAALAKKAFNLKHIEVSARCELTGHRLVDRYFDGERPWIFTKHWSGARGFTTRQKAIIRDCIRNVVCEQ